MGIESLDSIESKQNLPNDVMVKYEDDLAELDSKEQFEQWLYLVQDYFGKEFLSDLLKAQKPIPFELLNALVQAVHTLHHSSAPSRQLLDEVFLTLQDLSDREKEQTIQSSKSAQKSLLEMLAQDEVETITLAEKLDNTDIRQSLLQTGIRASELDMGIVRLESASYEYLRDNMWLINSNVSKDAIRNMSTWFGYSLLDKISCLSIQDRSDMLVDLSNISAENLNTFLDKIDWLSHKVQEFVWIIKDYPKYMSRKWWTYNAMLMDPERFKFAFLWYIDDRLQAQDVISELDIADKYYAKRYAKISE